MYKPILYISGKINNCDRLIKWLNNVEVEPCHRHLNQPDDDRGPKCASKMIEKSDEAFSVNMGVYRTSFGSCQDICRPSHSAGMLKSDILKNLKSSARDSWLNKFYSFQFTLTLDLQSFLSEKELCCDTFCEIYKIFNGLDGLKLDVEIWDKGHQCLCDESIPSRLLGQISARKGKFTSCYFGSKWPEKPKRGWKRYVS